MSEISRISASYQSSVQQINKEMEVTDQSPARLEAKRMSTQRPIAQRKVDAVIQSPRLTMRHIEGASVPSNPDPSFIVD